MITYADFEDYMQTKHQLENPTVLDDDIPDSYNDWIENLSPEEWMWYGQNYGERKVAEIKENI